MKVAEVDRDRIVVREVEDMRLSGRRGAVVRVLGCGLCGSDIVKFKHALVGNGAVLGHEIVAVIDEINSDTDFRVGEKIVTSHHIPCFECTYCKHGNYSMCEHFKATNIFPGGFSERVFVSEEHLQNVAYRVPEAMSNEEISFYEPLGCCVRAIKRTQLMKGDKVLVIGLGSIGLLMGEGLKAYGYDVYGCDLISERVSLANQMGIKTMPEDLQADAVFMTSGADKAIETALKNIKQGGKILVFSSTPNNWGYANNEIYYKELTVMGSYSPSPADLKESFELLVSGRVNVKGISSMYPLDKVQEAFDDTISNKTFKAYIKIGNE